MPHSDHGWYAVDLDGTLAVYPHSFPEIGPPIPAMIEKVKQWIAEGKDVRIFTARVANTGKPTSYGTDDIAWGNVQRVKIAAWCQMHLGTTLPVTATKDFQMIALYDDRCIQMIPNTGQSIEEELRELLELAEAIRQPLE